MLEFHQSWALLGFGILIKIVLLKESKHDIHLVQVKVDHCEPKLLYYSTCY